MCRPRRVRRTVSPACARAGSRCAAQSRLRPGLGENDGDLGSGDVARHGGEGQIEVTAAAGREEQSLSDVRQTPGRMGAARRGDAPLICGTALSGLVDKWDVTHDPAVKADAAKLAKGVLNLAILHGYKGSSAAASATARRRCRSRAATSTRTGCMDSGVTESSMADPEIVKGYQEQIVEVAKFMEERITAENQWNFGYADDYSKPTTAPSARCGGRKCGRTRRRVCR